MPLTPTGVDTPYCTAARLFVYHDGNQIADYLRDGDDPRPSRAMMLDATSGPGRVLQALGLAACGELEGACLVGKRYQVADLRRLAAQDPDNPAPDNSMGARCRLEKLVADLWFWACAQRRQPASADPDKIPGAKGALAALDQLREGVRVLGFEEAAAAGLPSVSQPDPAYPAVTGPAGASRLFGGHGPGQGYTRRRC